MSPVNVRYTLPTMTAQRTTDMPATVVRIRHQTPPGGALLTRRHRVGQGAEARLPVVDEAENAHDRLLGEDVAKGIPEGAFGGLLRPHGDPVPTRRARGEDGRDAAADQGHDGESPLHDEEEDQAHEAHGQAAECARGGAHEERDEGRDVLCEDRLELRFGRRHEVVDGPSLEVREHAGAQPVCRTGREAGEHPVADEEQHHLRDDQAEEQRRPGDQGAQIVFGQRVINQIAHHQRHGHVEERDDHRQGGCCDRQPRPLARDPADRGEWGAWRVGTLSDH